MRYLPILEELLESDLIVFMVGGLVISIACGVWIKSVKNIGIAACISFIVYVACEVILNIIASTFKELFILFIGTTAIGCVVGFIGCLIVKFLKIKLRNKLLTD